jgi:hypothetical protein
MTFAANWLDKKVKIVLPVIYRYFLADPDTPQRFDPYDCAIHKRGGIGSTGMIQIPRQVGSAGPVYCPAAV